jgi:hypothetical protein
MWGAMMPVIYYGLYCEPGLQRVYWILVGSLHHVQTLLSAGDIYIGSHLFNFHLHTYFPKSIRSTITSLTLWRLCSVYSDTCDARDCSSRLG